MTEYQEQTTRIIGSIFDGILLSQGKIRLRLGLKHGTEGLIFNLQNIYYLLNSPYNLVSLDLFNTSGIYYDNKNETLYKVQTKQILV